MARRFTGLLRASGNEKLLCFSFRDGQAVFVEQHASGEFENQNSFARALVQQGVLTRPQYAKAVREMRSDESTCPDIWFCDSALRLGMLTGNQIFDAFTSRIREKLIEAVGWEQCELELDGSPDALHGYEHYPVDPGPVLLEAVRQHFGAELIQQRLQGRFEQYATLRHSLSSIARRFQLDGNETQLLHLCNGKTTLTRIVQQSTLHRQHAWQLICLLMLSGFLELSENASTRRSAPASSKPPVASSGPAPPASERPRSQHPSDSDGVMSRSAMESLTRELRRRGSVDPDASASGSEPVPSSTPAPHQTVSSRPAASRSRSSRPASSRPTSAGSVPAGSSSGRPPTYSHVDLLLDRLPGDDLEALAATEAMVAWEDGCRLLRAREYACAREQFRLACQLDRRRGAYRMYFLWAARQSSASGDDEQRYPYELKRLAEAHTCIEGHMGIAFFILGHLALSEGNERAAERCFKDAFNYDSSMREAEEQYWVLARRRGQR